MMYSSGDNFFIICCVSKRMYLIKRASRQQTYVRGQGTREGKWNAPREDETAAEGEDEVEALAEGEEDLDHRRREELVARIVVSRQVVRARRGARTTHDHEASEEVRREAVKFVFGLEGKERQTDKDAKRDEQR